MSSRPWIDDISVDIEGHLRENGRAFDEHDVERLKQWRQNGFIVLRQAADSSLIDAYLNDLEWAFANTGALEAFVEVEGRQTLFGGATVAQLQAAGSKLNSIHAFSKAAAFLSLSPKLQRFLEMVFDEPAVALQSLTFWRGSQQALHTDYPYVKTQTKIAKLAAAWIALEDVSEQAGPLVYYPTSHRLEATGFFDWGEGSIVLEPDSVGTPHEFGLYLQKRMAEMRITPASFTPRKGDIFVWHANLVHGGSGIVDTQLTRKSYVTHYTAREAYPPDFRAAKPIIGINEFNAAPGIVWEYPWDAQKPKLPSWWKF